MEFMDSLLENLVDFLYQKFEDPYTAQLFEALEDKLTFLKSFIRFAILRSVEDMQLGTSLTHTQATSIEQHASLLCAYLSWITNGAGKLKKVFRYFGSRFFL